MKPSNAISNLLTSSALALLTFLVIFLVCEAAVRLFMYEKVDTEALKESIAATSIGALIEPSDNARIYYQLRPEMRTEFRGSLVVTGSDGYRIPDRELRAPAPEVRIALIGDSTAFGYRVDYADTYAEHYRREMIERTGRQIELRNYSVPGYNAEQELEVFVTRIADYRPDLLIVHHDHNDAQATGRIFPPTFLKPEYGDNALHSAFLKLASRRLRLLRYRFAGSGEDERNEFLDGYITSGPLYDKQLTARRELLARAQSLGIPAIAVIFDANIRADDRYAESERYVKLNKQISDHLARMGFYVLDLYPFYQEKMKQLGWSDLSQWWVSTDPPDAHPNPAGHRFIADSIVEFTCGEPDLIRVFGTCRDR